MKVSTNWLKQYVELPESIETLEKLLTNCGLEVASVEDKGKNFTNVVVGEVRTCEKHPNADKLSVCDVYDGSEVHHVVCGAPNVAKGQRIALARVGAYLAIPGFEIGKRKIRGEVSAGMICSEAELGISEDASGIIVLPDDAPLGTPLKEYLDITDVIVEIEITPNRGDALSHIGVARDIAALTGADLKLPELKSEGEAIEYPITLEDPSLCPRYSAAKLSNVKVGPSPDWLKQALEAVGIRSINNIVDVTNYVMMEAGQPMHAFDSDLLKGEGIRVRAAKKGEKLVTLDDKERTLREGDIVICDGEDRPIALGGVMGGANTEIHDGSTNVLLESAHFNSTSIRLTAKHFALHSESSYRFERTPDPNGTMNALYRAAEIIQEVAGGTLIGYADAYPKKIDSRSVELRHTQIGRILGIDIGKDEVLRILRTLGVEAEEAGEAYKCSIPTFRSDLEREIDLIEEIARIHGYDNIPTPSRTTVYARAAVDQMEFHERLKSISTGLGLDEIMSQGMIPEGIAKKFAAEQVITVMNPVNVERPAMRPSLIPSILETVSLNLRNQSTAISVFEIGSVYRKAADGQNTVVPGYDERTSYAIGLSGVAQQRSWYAPEREYDFFDLKGVITALLEALHIDNVEFVSYDKSDALSAARLQVVVGTAVIGDLVEVSPELLATYDIEQPVFIAELQTDQLETAVESDQKLKAISRYPVVHRDLAFVLASSIEADTLLNTIREVQAKYWTSAEVIDLYESEKLGKG
ncbi:MAG: phenylalanine--tRNA ligase subunit beta, partial [Ectothiorhodospiraceae bacterium]|nr:phenylalanine--tRNA ligase subunit beta [Ectothiorhodospiraceae bacterium]